MKGWSRPLNYVEEAGPGRAPRVPEQVRGGDGPPITSTSTSHRVPRSHVS